MVVALRVPAVEPGEGDGVTGGRCQEAEGAQKQRAMPGPKGEDGPDGEESCDEGLRDFEDGDATAQEEGLRGSTGGIDEEQSGGEGEQQRDGDGGIVGAGGCGA